MFLTCVLVGSLAQFFQQLLATLNMAFYVGHFPHMLNTDSQFRLQIPDLGPERAEIAIWHYDQHMRCYRSLTNVGQINGPLVTARVTGKPRNQVLAGCLGDDAGDLPLVPGRVQIVPPGDYPELPIHPFSVALTPAGQLSTLPLANRAGHGDGPGNGASNTPLPVTASWPPLGSTV